MKNSSINTLELWKNEHASLFNTLLNKCINQCKKTNKDPYKPKRDKDNCINVFADFECSTDGEKHIPYLCNISCTKIAFHW